jgi:flagellar motor switch/type III secretory pathway protein FliN
MARPSREGRPVPSAQRFPWQSLEAMTRLEAAAARNLRRWAAHHVRLDLIEGAMQELLGANVAIRTRHAGPLAGAGAGDGAIAVVLSPVEARAIVARGVLVEVEGALAATIAARVTKRPNPLVVNTGGARAVALAGAVAAVAGAVARRAHAETPLCISTAGSAARLEAELLRLDPGVAALSLTVLVGDDAFSARVAMSADRAAAAPCPSWDLAALLRLDATPLSMPIVACATTSTVADVGALGLGDVFFPGPSWLAYSARGPAGPVLLSPPSSEFGIRARLGDDGRLVLGGESEPLLAAAETDMSEPDEKAALLTAIGEVPVVVRVEIGEACMAARDWASLGRGDVVALGRRVGEHVVLRVGGLPVARGELVEIDGEVGVRIVERLSGGPTAS